MSFNPSTAMPKRRIVPPAPPAEPFNQTDQSPTSPIIPSKHDKTLLRTFAKELRQRLDYVLKSNRNTTTADEIAQSIGVSLPALLAFRHSGYDAITPATMAQLYLVLVDLERKIATPSPITQIATILARAERLSYPLSKFAYELGISTTSLRLADLSQRDIDRARSSLDWWQRKDVSDRLNAAVVDKKTTLADIADKTHIALSQLKAFRNGKIHTLRAQAVEALDAILKNLGD